MSAQEYPSWEATAAAKRLSTLAKIPKEWILPQADLERASRQRDLTDGFIEQYLSPEETVIIRQGSVSILRDIKGGKYSAVQVTRAFCKTAAIAHQVNNCLHEIFFDKAMETAKFLDKYLADTGMTKGPLHGLPISLKDQCHVKGVDTSMGFVGWIGTYNGSRDPNLVHKVDSQMVTDLYRLGAVLYCKTSVPQTLMWGETVNNIIGQTLNPSNHNLSCGGSSGGEGALQALRGSSIGLGTDIGGSVRVPAAFCGIFGIKPSRSRFSYRLMANVNPGQTTYGSSVGFLGTTIDALRLVMDSILLTQPWLRDPNVVPIPWRQDIADSVLSRATESGFSNDSTPLKFGILWTDNIVTPHPPISRGLRLVVDAVRDAGHQIVEWTPPSHKEGGEIHQFFMFADGYHDIHKQLDLSGEPLVPIVRGFQLRDPASLLKYYEFTVRGRDYESAYSDYWESTAQVDGQIVDAVIMPVAPHAAVIPGHFYHGGYTECISFLDYSSIVIPVTRANKLLDKPDGDFNPLSNLDAKNWEAYDSGIYDGAPVGIQIVARRYEEEKIWAIGKIVHSILQEAGVHGDK